MVIGHNLPGGECYFMIPRLRRSWSYVICAVIMSGNVGASLEMSSCILVSLKMCLLPKNFHNGKLAVVNVCLMAQSHGPDIAIIYLGHSSDSCT